MHWGRLFESNGSARAVRDLQHTGDVEDNWRAVEAAAKRAGETPDRYALKVLTTWMIAHSGRHAWLRVVLATVLLTSTTATALTAYDLATREPEQIIVVPSFPGP